MSDAKSVTFMTKTHHDKQTVNRLNVTRDTTQKSTGPLRFCYQTILALLASSAVVMRASIRRPFVHKMRFLRNHEAN